MNRSNTDEHDHFAPPPPTRRTCSSRRTASGPPRPPSRLGSKAGVHRKEYTFPRISMAHRESCYPQIEFLRLLTHCHANASLDSWRVLSAIRKTKGKRRRRKGNALFFFFLGAVGRRQTPSCSAPTFAASLRHLFLVTLRGSFLCTRAAFKDTQQLKMTIFVSESIYTSCWRSTSVKGLCFAVGCVCGPSKGFARPSAFGN